MSPAPARSKTRTVSTPGPRAWSRYSDTDLLDLRFCDLGLKIEGELAGRIDRLYDDLAAKGLAHFRPHCWLSSEWFSPDGVPGIAIPFYLARPRLKRLEKTQMLDVEGGTETSCLRILRHEAGHCIDTAYRLHRRKRWRELFGSFAEPYPDAYKPRPNSRKFVTHLDGWYAQAHPAEDFAETFAVWLQSSRWKSHYRGWPAMQKLEYVDELMQEIAASPGPTPVRSRRQVEPLSQDRRTLREHYRSKRLRYADEFPEFFDADLRKLFSTEPRYAHRPTAASFLRRIRPELRDAVARWTGTHAYTIDQVLRDMIDRCKELNLRLAVPETKAKNEAMMMVTVQTMNYMLSGHHPVAL
ncbi:MAG: putative zinc-binding metallopeptidase [Planctomycetota bacterium]